MIVSIVPRYEGEKIASAAVAGGATGGTIILGKGAAPNAILQFLGIGETAKDIVLSIADSTKAKSAITEIIKKASEHKDTGIAFDLEVIKLVRSGTKQESNGSEETMEDKPGTKLICAIVNDGYAEDAMAVARANGATGGTIIKARGTAKEDDAEFFGVHLVPEKEMLLVVVDEAKYDAVFSAIQNLPCFEKKGAGVVFAIPTDNFVTLGTK